MGISCTISSLTLVPCNPKLSLLSIKSYVVPSAALSSSLHSKHLVHLPETLVETCLLTCFSELQVGKHSRLTLGVSYSAYCLLHDLHHHHPCLLHLLAFLSIGPVYDNSCILSQHLHNTMNVQIGLIT